MSEEFTVFIDESFWQWFGLPQKGSNLCYGALSIPTDKLADLTRFESSLRQFAFDHLSDAAKAKQDPNEVKYAEFRHLSPDIIDALGKKLDYFLTKNNATIFGFFVPAEGFMNYKLRSDYIDDVESLRSLPEPQYEQQIRAIKTEMLKEWEDAEHNLGLLKEIYKTFFNFVVQYHGRYLRKSFRIIYDSRNPEEDAELHKDAEDFALLADRVTPGTFRHYKGYSPAFSHDSPGLRLVDWIAGEVRNFFYRNPAVLGGDSSLDILSPYANERMILMEGKISPFYRRELSPEAVDCFNLTGRGFMLPQIKKHFASGFLTYYAQHGEARHISIPELVAYDMAD